LTKKFVGNYKPKNLLIKSAHQLGQISIEVNLIKFGLIQPYFV